MTDTLPRYSSSLSGRLLRLGAAIAAGTALALSALTLPASAAVAAPTALLTVSARARVVHISAVSVELDVFTTGARTDAGAEMIPGHRSIFSTKAAILGGQPWSTAWRSVKKDSMLQVTVAMTPNARSSCQVVPQLLGTSFCARASNQGGPDYRPLDQYATLDLVSAAVADGYCGVVSKKVFGVKYDWNRFVGHAIRGNFCFFTSEGVPTGAAYLSDNRIMVDGGTQILFNDGKGYYFSLQVEPAKMVETPLSHIPSRGSVLKIALAADFVDDGDRTKVSTYSSLRLPR